MDDKVFTFKSVLLLYYINFTDTRQILRLIIIFFFFSTTIHNLKFRLIFQENSTIFHIFLIILTFTLI